MKNVVTKIFSVLMVLCYLSGIIGFDVHTCTGSGRNFVVAFFEGMSCEDIHPEHDCSHGSCCHARSDRHDACGCDHDEHASSEGVSITASSCCSNDYHALQLTGTLSSDSSRQYDGSFSLQTHESVIFEAHDFMANSFRTISGLLSGSDSVFLKQCDRQAVFSVWRI